jgi:hypothetical protein
MFLEIRLAPISRREWARGFHDPRLDGLPHLALELRARGYGVWFNVRAPPFHSRPQSRTFLPLIGWNGRALPGDQVKDHTKIYAIPNSDVQVRPAPLMVCSSARTRSSTTTTSSLSKGNSDR